MSLKAIKKFKALKFPSMSLLPELNEWIDLAEIDGYYAGYLDHSDTRNFTVKHLEWLEHYLEKNKELFVQDGIYDESKMYVEAMRSAVEEYVEVNKLKWK